MSERGQIVALLRSDLYERVADPDPDTGMTWESPLKWSVRITGERNEPVAEITAPSGERFWGPNRCTSDLLHEVLP